MKEDYTHISVILDRTGSMESIRDDTIGGFNAFLEDQKREEGSATLTLVQFDSEDPYEVIHSFKAIQDVPKLTRNTYIPRASTPLLDAMGRGINDLESSLSKLKEEERPAKVVMAIITDGQENASQEFTKDQIVKMINERTEKDDWQFVFLSSDLSAIQDAVAYGIQRDKSLHFQKTGAGTRQAFASLSIELSDYRRAKKKKTGFKPNPEEPKENDKNL